MFAPISSVISMVQPFEFNLKLYPPVSLLVQALDFAVAFPDI
jgi:hypothetical protein